MSRVNFDSQGKRGHFLQISSSPAAATVRQRTGHYLIYLLEFATDGTIWASGIEANDSRPANGTDPKAVIAPYASSGVIRHFEMNGSVLGSFIPHSSIGDARSLLLDSNLLAASGYGGELGTAGTRTGASSSRTKASFWT